MIIRSQIKVFFGIIKSAHQTSAIVRQKICFGSFALHQNRVNLGLHLAHNSTPRKLRSEETLQAENDVTSNRVHTADIVRLTKERDYVGARELFDSIENKNTIVYTAMIAGALRCGKIHEGIILFGEMRASGLIMTEPTYVTAMALYNRASQNEEGLALFQEMKEKGLLKNLPAFGSAINLYGNLSRYDAALEVWKMMLSHGLKPDNSIFVSITNAAAMSGQITAAEGHIEEMALYGLKPTERHYSCILKACRIAKNPDHAEKVFQQMEGLAITPNVLHYTLLMSVYRVSLDNGQESTLNRISALVTKMQNQGVQPDSFFVEEHLGALLGGSLQDFLRGKLPAPSSNLLEKAVGVINDFRASNQRCTSLIERVEAKLTVMKDMSAHGVQKQEEVGEWLETVDPASGNTYYWHSISRDVSWHRPSS